MILSTSRTVGTLRALLGRVARLNIVGKNPAVGVRQLAVERRQRRLSDDELHYLGKVMRSLAAKEEHPTGLAAIRMMLLSGFRRMEVLGLERSWVSRRDHCVRFPDTKSGAQIRILGDAAISCVEARAGTRGFALRIPSRLGRRPFRWCRPGTGSGVRKGGPQRRDAACSSAHIRQCRGGSGIF